MCRSLMGLFVQFGWEEHAIGYDQIVLTGRFAHELACNATWYSYWYPAEELPMCSETSKLDDAVVPDPFSNNFSYPFQYIRINSKET